jgi:hypothetical protein
VLEKNVKVKMKDRINMNFQRAKEERLLLNLKTLTSLMDRAYCCVGHNEFGVNI